MATKKIDTNSYSSLFEGLNSYVGADEVKGDHSYSDFVEKIDLTIENEERRSKLFYDSSFFQGLKLLKVKECYLKMGSHS